MKVVPLFAAMTCLAATACVPQAVEKLPYYKMSVIQGVPLDSEAVLSIQTGMTKEQVTLILGEPLLKSTFRDNRWDYQYQITKGGKIKENRNLTLQFSGNVLAHVSGSALEYTRTQLKQKGE